MAIAKAEIAVSKALSKIFSYDFAKLISGAEDRSKIELETSFRFGTDDDLDRILLIARKECSAEDWPKEQIQLLTKLTVFGREFTGFTVFISGELPRDANEKRSFLKNLGEWFDLCAEKLGYRWRYAGFVHWPDDNIATKPQAGRGEIYSSREDKAENAPAFLKRVYADELAAGTMTLSDLRQRDKSLWAGLRNWANAGNHNLDDLLPRGRRAARVPPDFDASQLNPDNVRDALVLQALKVREQTRERVRRHRQKVDGVNM